MHISEFRVKNYKSIWDSGQLTLSPGFNIIIGQNNAGKSALTEALGLRFENKPHRSEVTLPKPTFWTDPHSQVRLEITLSHEELITVLSGAADQFYSVGLGSDGNTEAVKRFFECMPDPLRLKAEWYGADASFSAWFRGFGEQPQLFVAVEYSTEEKKVRVSPRFDAVQAPQFPLLAQLVAKFFKTNVYRFDAERLKLGERYVAGGRQLSSDAANLAEVLCVLQLRSPWLFERLNEALRVVFPQVKRFTAPSIGERGQVRVDIWSVDTPDTRDDLAVPLSASGTGLGQVLAILYVVLTSTEATTIIIDEPQSFLHPSAIRRLFEVFRQYPQHQYIVATHSPAVITASEDPKIFRVERKGSVSRVIETEGRPEELRDILNDVGAKFSDAFGADRVCWVEGPSEEKCLSLIIGHFDAAALKGTEIVAVVHTGDLQGRHAKIVRQVYQKLSASGSLFPPALGFVFDRERLTDEEVGDLERQSGGEIKFIPRRMLENYLLHPSAIAATLNDLDSSDGAPPVSADQVGLWLKTKGREQRFLKGGREEDWVSSVAGSKVLAALFEDLTDFRVTFDKVPHDRRLTEWLLQNDPEHLRELADFFLNILRVHLSEG
jgi:predicted ATPase